MNQKNQNKDTNLMMNTANNINNKGKLRYGKDHLQDENFILKQVKSCQSEESDGVINDY